MKLNKRLTPNKKPEPHFHSIDDESPLEWDHLGKNLKEFWVDLFKDIVE